MKNARNKSSDIFFIIILSVHELSHFVSVENSFQFQWTWTETVSIENDFSILKF